MPFTPIQPGQEMTAESLNSPLRELEASLEPLYNQTDENGNIVLEGRFNLGWLQIAQWRLWVDDNGHLRAIDRQPANHADGFDMVSDLPAESALPQPPNIPAPPGTDEPPDG